MTTDEITAAIVAWQTRMQELEKQYGIILDTVGGGYDSLLGDAIAKVMDAYTDSVALSVDDDDEWLHYYRYDCEWGNSPQTVTIGDPENPKQTYQLNSPRALALIISETKP